VNVRELTSQIEMTTMCFCCTLNQVREHETGHCRDCPVHVAVNDYLKGPTQ
jgi:hypothetical protein